MVHPLSRLALSLVVSLSLPAPSLAADYYLSAPTQAAMITGLVATGQYVSGAFSSAFSSSFATAPIRFSYYGNEPDGGSYRITVLGTLLSPQASTATQPKEPGNFTNRVGQRVQPGYVTGSNLKVGIESIPDTVSAFWIRLSWNSSVPLPNFGAQGLTVYPINSSSQPPPFGGHF